MYDSIEREFLILPKKKKKTRMFQHRFRSVFRVLRSERVFLDISPKSRWHFSYFARNITHHESVVLYRKNYSSRIGPPRNTFCRRQNTGRGACDILMLPKCSNWFSIPSGVPVCRCSRSFGRGKRLSVCYVYIRYVYLADEKNSRNTVWKKRKRQKLLGNFKNFLMKLSPTVVTFYFVKLVQNL